MLKTPRRTIMAVLAVAAAAVIVAGII